MLPKIYEVLEIMDARGDLTGKYRMAVYRHGETPKGLCEHRHRTPEEAVECPVVRDIIDHEFSPRSK